ncbi:unnamed protein product [Oncorhynchus mykiss]|uniref:Fibronectin type-III domain-containing protein n=1 Tax=Oncorhynchus mykiss TaxID=8022 RepID=A0A060YVM8_ONCMY|nr:unnamed protein product [Oncorhynchus mykiss]
MSLIKSDKRVHTPSFSGINQYLVKNQLTLQPSCEPELCTPVFFTYPSLPLCLPLQETVSAGQRSFVARELKSETDYLVTIIPQYPNSVGEPVSAKARTKSLPGVSGLRLIQAGFFSLSLGWDAPTSQIQGYRLTYGPRGQPAAQLLEQSLAADSTSVTLERLLPDTEYVLTLYPLFPRNSVSPATLTSRTCKYISPTLSHYPQSVLYDASLYHLQF